MSTLTHTLAADLATILDAELLPSGTILAANHVIRCGETGVVRLDGTVVGTFSDGAAVLAQAVRSAIGGAL